MNELESLSQLNKMLLAESPQYLAQAAAFPPDAEAQWRLFRSLVNVRAPRPAGGDFLALQDSLLQKITACKGVTAFHSLTPMQKGLYLWRGDITTLQTDGIVNAANSGLTGCYHPCHQCIDNAIHTFSGVQLRLACASIIKAQGRPEPAGQAKITRAYNLPCRYVLHTVGPAVAGSPLTEGPRFTGVLLPFLSCGGCGMENEIRGFLLYFYRRVSFSQRAGGANRRGNRETVYE